MLSPSMLPNVRDVTGLLRNVKEVVLSSRVNVGQLVDYIIGLPKRVSSSGLSYDEDYFDDGIPDNVPADEIKFFLDPSLKFKVLYGGSTGAAPAKIIEHVPESFFSFEINSGSDSVIPLREKVDSIFKRKIRIFAHVLQCSSKVEIHEALLYHILPFLWGGDISEGILRDTVAHVGKLLGDTGVLATSEGIK